jgi:tRNA modification GTPase
MELELDFSDEDVEFADRSKLYSLLDHSINHINILVESFKLGNVIKNGVPVAIVGATNTGKSTLLNTILGEDRAIVSDVHGTTRDFIEDVVNIDGVAFRFIDTAGIRKTKEEIEIIGIERTYEKIKNASVVVLMLDSERPDNFIEAIKQLKTKVNDNQTVIAVLNKVDTLTSKRTTDYIDRIREDVASEGLAVLEILPLSAKMKNGIDKFKSLLIDNQKNIDVTSNMTLVSNIRHYEALKLADEALVRVRDGLDDGLSTDLLTQDIREALFNIGQIVGEVNTEEILGNIFSRFCIGK